MRLHACSRIALATIAMLAGATAAPAGVHQPVEFQHRGVRPVQQPGAGRRLGVATVLGMDNNYTFSSGNTITGTGTFTYTTLYSVGSVASADVLATSGDPNGDPNAWRIRGPSNNVGAPLGNGWALQAPQYTQGAQFSSSTAGYNDIGFHFDWYTTAQAVDRLQEQYTLDGTNWININSPIAAPSGGGWLSETIDFSGIAGASNDPNFGVAWSPLTIRRLRFSTTAALGGLLQQ